MTRLLSPHNYIIYIIYLNKIFISLFIFLLSLSPIIHENIYIYIKKILYLFIYVYLFIYLLHKYTQKNLFLPKYFATFISYFYIIIIKISRNTIKSLSPNYPENNILWIRKINVNSFSEVFNNSTKIYNIYNINNINHTKSI